MKGAIIGDFIGSSYEHNNTYDYNFKLFTSNSCFTDDSILTIATMNTLLELPKNASELFTRKKFVENYKKWGLKYPNAGYGGNFLKWLYSDKISPYNSYGNGSAMRVSPVGYFYDDLYMTKHMARLSASVTHNHIEGIKGAESTAAMIYLLRNKYDLSYIANYIEKEYGYNLLNMSYNKLKKENIYNENCQKTVPAAMTCFFYSNSFEDCIRKAISIGGDSDTIAAIAGGFAEVYYGIDNNIYNYVLNEMDKDMINIVNSFYEKIKE